MRDGRRFGDMRLMALLLLAMALLSGNAFAQGAPDPSFPFLSIDPAQLDTFFVGLQLQWSLFKGYNDGTVPALYYIALAATMVGALSIIFNKTLHNTRTIIAWFLMVVICLFAPYSSKLLFYPVKQPPSTIAQRHATPGSPTEVHGFTPQLAAAHVGTTLQVVFTDLFNSMQWNSLVDEALAQASLSRMPEMALSPNNAQAIRNFNQDCQTTPIAPQSLQSTEAQPNGTDASNSTPSFTLDRVLDNIKGHYLGNATQGHTVDKSAFQTPPPMIVLDPAAVGNPTYDAGIATLYKLVTGKQLIYYDKTRIEGALTELTDLARGANTSSPVPLSLFHYMQVGNYEADATGAKAARNNIEKSCNPGYLQWGINRVGFAPVNCDDVTKSLTNELTRPGTSSVQGPYQNALLANVFARLDANPDMKRALAAMPVSQGTSTSADGPMTVTNNVCDPATAETYFNTIMSTTALGETSRLAQLINGELGDVPTTKKEWEAFFQIDGIGSSSLGNYYGLANGLADAFTGPYSQAAFERATSGLSNSADIQRAKRQVLADIITTIALKSSAANTQKAIAEQNGGGNSMDADNTSWFGKVLAIPGEAVARAVVYAGSYLAGLAANIVLSVMPVIIDMTLLAILIITPIIFLFGIALPAHAAGLLIQSVLMVFILKLVPLTFLLVDRVGSIIYTALEASGDNSGALAHYFLQSDVQLKQAIFLFGIATIYASLVGMTMFLLFKIGDPQNIQKLTQLDNAAEKVAEAGERAAKAMAFVAAAIATGGALGGAGWVANKLSGRNSNPPAGDADKGDAGSSQPGPTLGSPTTGGHQPAVHDEPLPDDADEEDPSQISTLSAATQATDSDTADSDDSEPLGSLSPPETATSDQDEDLHGMPDAAAVDQPEPDATVNEPTDADTKAPVSVSPASRAAARRVFGAVTALPTLSSAQEEHVIEQLAQEIEEGNVTEEDAKEQLRQIGALAGGVGYMPTAAGPGQPTHSIASFSQGPQIAATGVPAAPGTTAASTVAGTSPAAAPGTSTTTAAGQTIGASQPSTPDPLTQREDQLQQILNQLRSGITIKNLPAHMQADASALDSARHEFATNAAADLKAAEVKADSVAAEKKPGFWRSVGSGMYGAATSGGTLGQLSVLGPIKEIFNEFTEAPERARVWANNGGMMKWRSARRDAARLEHLKNASAPYGPAAEYQALGQHGSYNAMVQIARRTAHEAAGKAHSEGMAIRMKESDLGRRLNANDFKSTEIVNAIQSLDQTLKASAMLSGGSVQVQGGEVTLTPRVIQRMAQAKGHKQVEDQLNNLLSDHMYFATKYGNQDYLDSLGTGPAPGRAARMQRAGRSFIKNEIGTDYQVDTLIDWVKKKENFKRKTGMAEAIRDAIGTQKVMLDEFILKNPGASTAQIEAFKSKLAIDRIHTYAQVGGYHQQFLSSYQAKDIAGLKDDFSSQLKQMKDASRLASAFSRNLQGNLNSMLQYINSQGVAIQPSVVNNLSAAFSNLPRSARARLGYSFKNPYSIDDLVQAFEEAGIHDPDALNTLRDILRRRP